MAAKKRFIAFDLGAESGRCVVGELSDRKLRLHEVHRFTTPSIECMGHFYWNVLGIYQELEKGLSNAVSEFGDTFDGVSLDTWGVDYVLLDPDGRLLGYPYHYRDSRTDDMIRKASETLPRAEIYHHTGIQFMQFNTLFQFVAEQQQQLNLLEIADRFLPVPNYLLYLLSGEMKAEYTHASTSQMCNPRTRDWSWELIEAFGFPGAIFPEMVEPGTQIGTIHPPLAEKTGISPDTPVIATATHDTAAAVVSMPAPGDHWAYLSSGTWSLMGVELEAPLITENSLQYNYTNEGGAEGTTRFLKNIMGLWPLQETKRYWEEQGKEYTYDELQSLAAETDPAEAWVDVNDNRFLKPGNMPEKILTFLEETGQSYREEDDWIVRCILESLAIKYRQTVKELEELTGHTIQRLHAVGGGIQNELLNQLTADAIGRPVIAGPVEGTAAGNIGVQAIASGAIEDLAAFREVVAHSFPTSTYRPKNAEYWDRQEENFFALLQKNA